MEKLAIALIAFMWLIIIINYDKNYDALYNIPRK